MIEFLRWLMIACWAIVGFCVLHFFVWRAKQLHADRSRRVLAALSAPQFEKGATAEELWACVSPVMPLGQVETILERAAREGLVRLVKWRLVPGQGREESLHMKAHLTDAGREELSRLDRLREVKA
jgi:hypothetical protein